jgi:molybdopterin-guanine dinucleotide biosynthesis protein A
MSRACGPVAILLAAGRSERLGRDKPTLVVGDETLLERHVRQARASGVQRFVVVASEDNASAIRAIGARVGIDSDAVCLQQGRGAEGAVLTGMRRASGADTAFVCCTNDVVSDDGYVRIADHAGPGVGLVVAGARLEWRFVGGMLVTSQAANELLCIEERRREGCPPGAIANVMIHRFAGRDVLARLAELLAAGNPYETSVNNLITIGVPARIALLERWVGVKSAEDLVRLETRFGLTVKAATR